MMRSRSMIILLCMNIIGLFFPLSSLANEQTGERQTYRIAGDQYLPPFSYVNKEGEFVGFSVDLFKRIAERENVSFEFIPLSSYKAIELLKKGEIDAIMGMKYSNYLNHQFLFSDAYFMVSDTFVLPKKSAHTIRTLIDLREKVVLMQEDQAAISMMKNVRGSQIMIALNSRDAFSLLMDERADALLTNKWTAEYYIKENNAETDFEVLDHLTGTSAEFSAAVYPNHYMLVEMINSAMEEMKENGEYTRIYSRWFHGMDDVRLKELKTWMTILIIFLALIFIALLVVYVWNKKLKIEVKKRTFALEQVNQKLSEQQMELSKANQYKENILNHIFAGIITFDKENTLTSMNPRARTILNLENNKIIEAEDILSLPTIQKLLNAYKTECRKNHENVFSKEIEYEENGERKSVLFRIIPFQANEMVMEGFMLTLTDRSEERMLQKKLVLQEKMGALGQLVAGVAHEIRNPLMSLKVFVEMLPKKYMDPEFRKEMLHHVPEAVKRMNRIVESLIGYSRRNEIKRETFLIQDCVQAIIDIMEPTLKNNGVSLVQNIDKKATAYGDQHQIGQILLNLMINGLDAMSTSQEKVMTVSAYNDGSFAYIEVADTGCGIEPEALNHIFEPFYTTKSNGVGLGLALCYQWAVENNGVLDVKPLHKGTKFVIKLPSVQNGGK